MQRKVFINRSSAYDGNEVIAKFDYIRDGSPGGNHFVSDKLIRNIVGEVVVGKKRDGAMLLLSTLWAGTKFAGTFDIVPWKDTAHYDKAVNSLISGISNQSSNLFTCEGTGDDSGRQIDRPLTPSGEKQVQGYAKKLINGLDGIKDYLGPTGTKVLLELADFLNY